MEKEIANYTMEKEIEDLRREAANLRFELTRARDEKEHIQELKQLEDRLRKEHKAEVDWLWLKIEEKNKLVTELVGKLGAKRAEFHSNDDDE